MTGYHEFGRSQLNNAKKKANVKVLTTVKNVLIISHCYNNAAATRFVMCLVWLKYFAITQPNTD